MFQHFGEEGGSRAEEGERRGARHSCSQQEVGMLYKQLHWGPTPGPDMVGSQEAALESTEPQPSLLDVCTCHMYALRIPVPPPGCLLQPACNPGVAACAASPFGDGPNYPH